MNSARARHAIEPAGVTDFWIIFFKCIGWLVLGAAAGFAFFYFFKDFSVTLIDRYKFIQGIFGIKQFQPGTGFSKVLLTIFAGNLISTAAYFAIGWLRTLIPVSILTGFIVTVLLFTGTVRNQQPVIPLEVIILVCIEAFTDALHLLQVSILPKTVFAKKLFLHYLLQPLPFF